MTHGKIQLSHSSASSQLSHRSNWASMRDAASPNRSLTAEKAGCTFSNTTAPAFKGTHSFDQLDYFMDDWRPNNSVTSPWTLSWINTVFGCTLSKVRVIAAESFPSAGHNQNTQTPATFKTKRRTRHMIWSHPGCNIYHSKRSLTSDVSDEVTAVTSKPTCNFKMASHFWYTELWDLIWHSLKRTTTNQCRRFLQAYERFLAFNTARVQTRLLLWSTACLFVTLAGKRTLMLCNECRQFESATNAIHMSAYRLDMK